MNFDKTIPSQKYANLLGIAAAAALWKAAPEDNVEIAAITAKMRTMWVYTDYTPCEQLEVLIKAVDNDITSHMTQKTNDDSKGNQRVQNRYITAGTNYKNELQLAYDSRQCLKLQEEAEEKDFFDDQYEQLGRVKGLSTDAGKASQYLIYGMLGVVVVVAMVIIMKKKKK